VGEVSRPRDAASSPKRQSKVTDALRSDIVSGTFLPGQRLPEERLALRYDVSRVPVREALRCLEAEGFVRISLHAGAVVAFLTESEAEDLLEVRISIEMRAVRRAAQRRTDEHLRRLDEILAAALAARAARRLDELGDLDDRFHRLVAEASATTHVLQLLEQLSAKIDWIYPGHAHARTDDCWAEHAELLSAIRAGDCNRASAIADEHVRRTAAAHARP